MILQSNLKAHVRENSNQDSQFKISQTLLLPQVKEVVEVGLKRTTVVVEEAVAQAKANNQEGLRCLETKSRSFNRM